MRDSIRRRVLKGQINMQFRIARWRTLWVAGLALAAVPLLATADGTGSARRLSFGASEGLNLNSFLREGPVAAHLLLRSGPDPRILVAFPAGNSGVGLWFAHCDQPVTWALQSRPAPVSAADDQGRTLYGVVAEASVTGADLAIKQAVLSASGCCVTTRPMAPHQRSWSWLLNTGRIPSPGRVRGWMERPVIDSASK